MPFSEKDLARRRQLGSEVTLKSQGIEATTHDMMKIDEKLPELDRDNLTSK
jgi:hypothetical protein